VRHSLLVISLALVLTGCIGGRSPAPDYHMLTARARAAGTQTASTTSIGVGPVQVAQFLTRPPIVTHGGGNALKIDDHQRWGEPLDQGIQRVLLQNIAALTGAQTRGFPWRQRTIPDYAVRVDVLDLDRLPDGNAVLEVSWILEDLKQGRLVYTRQERLTQPVSGGYDALTEAYSQLMAQLSQRIVAALPH